MLKSLGDYPIAVNGLEINEVTDGYVVHQHDRDRVHYLNATAAILLELCNGKNRTADLPELLRSAFQLPTAPVADVQNCLLTLRNEGLIL